MTIVIFILILAILVFVHELGHFVVAKISGIRVDEFAIGFPPKIVSFKRGETTYAINLIPFGGYVKIFGENPDDDSMKGPDSSRSFVNKPKYIQAIVLVAGIGFNILFAWVLISFGFMTGMPVPQDYAASGTIDNIKITVLSITKNSPAEKAGLKSGDALVGFSDGAETVKKFSIVDFQNFVAAHDKKPVQITYLRGESVGEVSVAPAAGIVSGRATIGVTLDAVGTLRLPIHKAIYEGTKLTYSVTKTTAVSLADFLYHAVIGRAELSQVTGPIGIANIVGDVRNLGFVYLVSFTAFISINLAIINLIPFPALDGGRLLFVLIEKIKGSPIKPVVANTVNTIGFALLIILMLVITYHDIAVSLIN